MIQKKNIICLVGGFFILSAIIIFFIIFPLLSNVIKNSEEVIAKKKNLDYFLERYQKQSGELQNLDEIINKIEEFYINPRRPIDQVLFFREMALKNNLEIDINITQSKDIGNNIWPYLNFNISVQGQLSDFFVFLEKIKTTEWFITINRLNIRKVKEIDVATNEFIILDNNIIADVSLKIYFQK